MINTSRCVPDDNRDSVPGTIEQLAPSYDDNSSARSCCSSHNALTDEEIEPHITPEYTGNFEGPEKTMEVVFRPDMGNELGLRALTRDQLDQLCTLAKCSILSKISNNHLDAYVLSESSLFVYKHRWIMKTCGTTTLLRCLSSLLAYADVLGMELTWVGYSRKNLNEPNAQLYPHSSFDNEVSYINSHDKLQERLHGSGYILGPITGDHWFVYVADHSHTSLMYPINPLRYMPSLPANERTINLMMFDMALDVAALFYKAQCPTGKEMTKRSGIDKLCPGAQIDETSFEPCGYSMNAILHDSYFTIHITPEESCSYVSFETNTALEDYSALMRNVLNVFRPKRFVITMFGDQDALDKVTTLPTDARKINMPQQGCFRRTSVSSTKVNMDIMCLMACYSFQDAAIVKQQQLAVQSIILGSVSTKTNPCPVADPASLAVASLAAHSDDESDAKSADVSIDRTIDSSSPPALGTPVSDGVSPVPYDICTPWGDDLAFRKKLVTMLGEAPRERGYSMF